MTKIYSISLGCPKNRVDTERLLAGVPGFQPVAALADADCVLINTCGFIEPAVRESVSAIAESIEDITELGPEAKPLLAVAGCLVGRYGREALGPELPEVDLWLDNRDLSSWRDALLHALAARGLAGTASGTPPLRALSTGPSYAWLKISEGCDHTCSFCTIPLIRGRFVSAPADLVKAEATELLGQGVRELILVAQDSTAWGRDLAGSEGDGRLMHLLDALLPLPGLDRLRIMYQYPAGLTPALLDYLRRAGSPFVPYFDVPLQHAHDDVLARMGRPFARNPRLVVDRIREYFPDAALRTSIIVGFPGETEEQFRTLCDFVRDVRFHHLGVFAYRAEEGTRAATMADQIPDPLKEERRDILMAIQADISEAILADCEGETLDVLVDAAHPEWPGLFVGRTWFQAPEVDGLTYVSGPEIKPGDMVRADIVETRTYDLVGLV